MGRLPQNFDELQLWYHAFVTFIGRGYRNDQAERKADQAFATWADRADAFRSAGAKKPRKAKTEEPTAGEGAEAGTSEKREEGGES